MNAAKPHRRKVAADSSTSRRGVSDKTEKLLKKKYKNNLQIKYKYSIKTAVFCLSYTLFVCQCIHILEPQKVVSVQR